MLLSVGARRGDSWGREALNTLVFAAKTAVEGATITGARNAAHTPPAPPAAAVPGPAAPKVPALNGVNPDSPSNPRFSMFNKKLALAKTSLSDAPPRTERTIGGGVVVVVYIGGRPVAAAVAAEAWAWP